MDEVVLSPDGKRLAWKLHARENGAGSGLLARLLAYFGARPRAMISLWVSRLDGSDFHEIGHEEAPPMHVWPEAIREAQWTPDGRHVSFLFQDALWTVPAE